MNGDITVIEQVRAALSTEEFVRLAEALGGDRIYVPMHLKEDHQLIEAIGPEAALRIVSVFPIGGWLAVPLAKLERALLYEAQGLKDHQIARKLCMTRSGVQKMLDRNAQLAGDS